MSPANNLISGQRRLAAFRKLAIPVRPTACMWYERTRNLSAFNILGYIRKHSNASAVVYTFADGSQFVVYGSQNGKGGDEVAWRDAAGYIKARRSMW